MGLHLRLVVAEDEDRFFSPEPLGDARGIHRRVAAADDTDHAPERRRATLFHALHERHGIDDLAAVHGRNIEMVGDVGADPEEHGVERACGLLGQHVGHTRVANDPHPHRLDTPDLPVDPLAWEAVRRNPVAHHPARFGVRIADLDVVATASQLVGARQAGRAGADDEDALTGGRARGDGPAFLVGKIAEKPVERMDRHGLIEELPVAGGFARMVTGAAVCAGQRVLFHVLPPGLLVVTRLRQSQPRLDVFPCRAGVVAGRKMIDVFRALPSTRSGTFADRFVVNGCQILWNEAQAASSWLSWEPRERADGRNLNGLPSVLSPFLLARPRHVGVVTV